MRNTTLVRLVCVECETVFERSGSQVKHRTRQNVFCSKICCVAFHVKQSRGKNIVRFLSYIEPTETCMLWKGRKNSKTKRALFRVNNKQHYAARWIWIYLYGNIENDIHVLHYCDNTKCLNPNHLFIGTQLDNISDRDMKGRNRSAQTHCKNGHLLREDNIRLYVPKKQYRACRQCARKFTENYRQRKMLYNEVL